MIKYFLVPITEPPWSKPPNNQRPKYIVELRINTSISYLVNSMYCIVKAGGTQQQLLDLQNSPGVIDFPNIDNDTLDSLPTERKAKDKEIKRILKLEDKSGEKVKDFINRCACSEGNFAWDKDLVYVPE